MKNPLFLVFFLAATAQFTPFSHSYGSETGDHCSHRTVTAQEDKFTALFAAWRKARGLAPLRRKGRLDKASRNYGCTLTQTGHFDHVGRDGSTPMTRAEAAGYTPCLIAENLGKGQHSAQVMLGAWEASLGHLRNMLIEDAVHIGVSAISLHPAGGGSSVSGLESRSPSLGDIARSNGGMVVGSGRRGASTSDQPMTWVLMLARPC